MHLLEALSKAGIVLDLGFQCVWHIAQFVRPIIVGNSREILAVKGHFGNQRRGVVVFALTTDGLISPVMLKCLFKVFHRFLCALAVSCLSERGKQIEIPDVDVGNAAVSVTEHSFIHVGKVNQ